MFWFDQQILWQSRGGVDAGGSESAAAAASISKEVATAD